MNFDLHGRSTMVAPITTNAGAMKIKTSSAAGAPPSPSGWVRPVQPGRRGGRQRPRQPDGAALFLEKRRTFGIKGYGSGGFLKTWPSG